jgi:hypothetical protein
MCLGMERHVLDQEEHDHVQASPFIKRPEIRRDATLPVPLYKQFYERLRCAIRLHEKRSFPHVVLLFLIEQFPKG